MSKKNKEKEVISEEVFFLNGSLIKEEDLSIQTFRNGKIVIWFKGEVVVEGWEKDSLVVQAIQKLNSK